MRSIYQYSCSVSLAILVGGASVSAQTNLLIPQGYGHPTSAQINSLLDRVSGLREEYKADLALHILKYEADKISPRRKIAILKAVFDDASSARYPAKMIYASNHWLGIAVNDSQFLEGTHLNSLEIQTTVVSLSLRDTPAQSVNFFSQIEVPRRRAFCADPSVEDLSSYYETLVDLLKDERVKSIAGLPKKEFFLEKIREADTIERLTPALTAVNKLVLGADDMRAAGGYISHNLDRLETSDREMRALSDQLLSGMSSLGHNFRLLGLSSASVLAALRSMLIKGFSTDSCGDTTAKRATIAKSFNSILSASSTEGVATLDPKDLKQGRTDVGAVDPIVPVDKATLPSFRRVIAANQARRLEMYDSGGPSFLEPESSDIEELLHYALSQVSSQSLCETCELVSRGQLFENIQNALPAGQKMESWISAEVNFLSFNRLEDEDPAAYLGFLKTLLYYARPVSTEVQKRIASQKKGTVNEGLLPIEEPQFVAKELRNSADPVVQAYASYEALFQPAFVPSGEASGR